MAMFEKNAIVVGIGIALLSMMTETNAAQSPVSANDALEQRIKELEKRLARFEKLERLQESTESDAGSTKTAQAPTIEEYQKLKTKVNTLERKVEVEKEVSDANFLKLPRIDAGPEGFKISSQDNKNQLRLRAALQTDATVFAQDNNGAVGYSDRLSVQQARLWAEGVIQDKLYYKLMPDFANSTTLVDSYVDYAYANELSLTAGKFKSPQSLERLQGDSDTVFTQRAYPTGLASNRDIGFQVHGGFAKPGYQSEYAGTSNNDTKNWVSYQVGVFDGTIDNGNTDATTSAKTAVSPTSSAPTSNNKEFDARFWVNPFQHSSYAVLEGFGFGLSGSYSHPSNLAGAAYYTPSGQTKVADFSGTVNNGDHIRYQPQAYWYYGPFGFMGEYAVSQQNLTGTSGTDNKNRSVVSNNAWQTQFTYNITGEDSSFSGVKPIQKFDPSAGTWGALQAAFRFTQLNIDPNAFKTLKNANGYGPLLAANQNVQFAQTWTAGFNWILNQNALIRADYEETAFSGGAGSANHVQDRQKEKVFATRFQLTF